MTTANKLETIYEIKSEIKKAIREKGVPVSNDFNDYAKKVDEALKAVKIRSNAYLSEDNMRCKIKVITKEHKTPYILIVGENEQKEGTVSVRFRQSSGLEQKTMKIEEFIAYVQEKNAEKGTNI